MPDYGPNHFKNHLNFCTLYVCIYACGWNDNMLCIVEAVSEEALPRIPLEDC